MWLVATNNALHNSRFRIRSESRRAKRAKLSINAKAAERLGLGNGDWVRIKRERSRTRFLEGAQQTKFRPRWPLPEWGGGIRNWQGLITAL